MVNADWIDYSECDATKNTKVFGLDRGNHNSGTQVDEDLIEHRTNSNFYASRPTVTFFDWEAVTADPPYASPEDAIVAAQRAVSTDAPCLNTTSDHG